MKKTKLLLCALLALTLTGCENNRVPVQEQQRLDDMYRGCLNTVNYRGHSYIIFCGDYQGGITHDPGCPCREKEDCPDYVAK